MSVAVENLKVDGKVDTLDMDLLINADRRVSNQTYLHLLTSLCQIWSHEVLKIEDELQMTEDQLLLVSKLFTRQNNLSQENQSDQPLKTLNELSQLLYLMVKKHAGSVVTQASTSNKSTLADIAKLVLHVQRKIQLKREFSAFETETMNNQHLQTAQCPICRSMIDGTPSDWFIQGTASCRDGLHTFSFDYTEKRLKTSNFSLIL